MGLVPSLMRRGLSPKQILSLAIQGIYKNIETSKVGTFEDFHSSILNLYKHVLILVGERDSHLPLSDCVNLPDQQIFLRTANSALPGRHFEAPSRGQVKKAFDEWTSIQNEDKKREIFMELLKNIKLGEIDNLTLIVGLAAPPFSMAAKRAGENVYPFQMIKRVPDALFVPSFTLLSVVSVKLIRKVLKGITEEEEEEEEINAHTSRRDNTTAPQGAN